MKHQLFQITYKFYLYDCLMNFDTFTVWSNKSITSVQNLSTDVHTFFYFLSQLSVKTQLMK